MSKLDLKKIKNLPGNLMEKLKEINPDATWANFVVGVLILVVLAILSVNYFAEAPQPTPEQDLLEMFNQVNEAGNTATPEPGTTTTVQSGEGLWQVAKRVCGNGEAYNILANANGLTIYSSVTVGQELKVVCE